MDEKQKLKYFINDEYFMNEYEFVKFMEEKKEELIEEKMRFQKREIVGKILDEAANFKSRKSDSMFIFYGLRGIGKTTSLLQALGEIKGMYVDGDALSYHNLDLLNVIDEYKSYNQSRILLIDELASIKKWGKALKIIHDMYGMKIIATGSSAIKIDAEKKEIIRRARFFELSPLSFKEYLKMKHSISLQAEPKEIEDVLFSNPSDGYVKAKEILLRIKNDDINRHFREYLMDGFPLCFEMKIEEAAEYILDKIIADDFPLVAGFNLEISEKAKKIASAIALSKPGATSLSTFSEIAECSKTTASNILSAFEASSLIIPVMANKTGASKLRKEVKELFSSPALRYGLKKKMGGDSDFGGIREDFFVSSLYYGGIQVEYIPESKKSPDYAIIKNGKMQTVEIGGKGKGAEQVKKGIVFGEGKEIDFANNVLYLPLFFAGLL